MLLPPGGGPPQRLGRERRFDALHRAAADAEIGCDPQHATVAHRESSTNALLGLSIDPWPTEPLALSPGPRQSGANALLDHRALNLGEHAHHPKQRTASRRG